MRHHLAVIATAIVAGSWARTTHAQALDSLTFGVDTRARWRGYDRGDGLSFRESLSFALGGFSTNRNAGERNNFTADLLGWTPVAHRATRRATDQYQAAVTFARCLRDCDQNEWGKRTVLEVSGDGYSLPNATVGPTSTYELQTTLRSMWQIPQIGGTQVGVVLFPYLAAVHDFQRYSGTYVAAGLGTSIGPASGLTFSLDLGEAASDWPRPSTTQRPFGFHAFDVQLGVDRDQRIGSRHLSAHLAWDIQAPASSIGRPVGLVTLRCKVFGPAWMF